MRKKLKKNTLINHTETVKVVYDTSQVSTEEFSQRIFGKSMILLR